MRKYFRGYPLVDITDVCIESISWCKMARTLSSHQQKCKKTAQTLWKFRVISFVDGLKNHKILFIKPEHIAQSQTRQITRDENNNLHAFENLRTAIQCAKWKSRKCWRSSSEVDFKFSSLKSLSFLSYFVSSFPMWNRLWLKTHFNLGSKTSTCPISFIAKTTTICRRHLARWKMGMLGPQRRTWTFYRIILTWAATPSPIRRLSHHQTMVGPKSRATSHRVNPLKVRQSFRFFRNY